MFSSRPSTSGIGAIFFPEYLDFAEIFVSELLDGASGYKNLLASMAPAMTTKPIIIPVTFKAKSPMN
jgi:hypothetical protein